MTSRENALLAYRHKTPEWVPARSLDFNVIFPAAHIEKYQGTQAGTDAFGVRWVHEPRIGAPMPDPKPLLPDVTRWEEFVRIPNLEDMDWEKQAAADMAAAIPDRLHMTMSLNGMFERLHACMGMENALCSLASEPEACGAFASAIADHKIRMIEKIDQYYDIDVFNMNDDYGFNDHLFMSVDTWRAVYKPQLKRIIDAAHAHGMFYHQHCCGYLEPLVEDFVELGVDALDVWQASNKNMRAYKDRYQHVLTFCGGFDNIGVFDRLGATYEECYEETMSVLKKMAPGGSYIAYTVTAKTDFLPAFNQAVLDYRASVL